MRRLISWLFVLAFAACLLALGSYAGARFKAGQLLGPASPVSGPSSAFAFEGVQGVPGSPRAWVITYSQVRLPGVRRVRIVVSLTGKVLSVTPRDLEVRLAAYRRSLEP